MLHDDYQPTGHQPTSQDDEISDEPPEGTEYRRGLPLLGQKLLDRYEILRIMEGGFGIVYHVTNLQTNFEYAVKTYKRVAGVEQFKEEVDFWLNLDPYPHIVSAYFVEAIDDQPYLFMEYVDGGAKTSLRDRLHNGRLGVSQAFQLAYQLCLGMEFANRREFAHCDLKPENILLDKNDTLKVTDFGLAHQIRVVDGKYPTVQSGTWAYAPPELLAGEAVDSRSDIFSFGIILYEMLTGRLPYPFTLSRDAGVQRQQLKDFHTQGKMRELNETIYYHGIPDLQAPEKVSELVSACLTDYMGDRWRDFTVLREELEYHFGLSEPAANVQASRDDQRRKALSFHKIGRYSKALSLWNRLLLQYPDDSQLLLDAAKTLLTVGDKESAQTFIEQAIRLHPQLAQDPQLLDFS